MAKKSMLLATPSLVQGSVCEAQLLQAYSASFFPVVSNKCKACHVVGPGLGAFASPDINTSLASFRELGAARIKANAVNPNHKPPYTGSQNQPDIDAADAVWTAASSTYLTCLANSGDSELQMKTAEKAMEATAAVKILSWDLNSETAVGTQPQPVRFSIEVKVASVKVGTEMMSGYVFTNPKISVSQSGRKFAIDGFSIWVNGQLQEEITTYKNLKRVANIDEINLMPDTNTLLMRTPMTEDKIAIEFAGLQETNENDKPPEVIAPPAGGATPPINNAPLQTFRQLVAATGVIGKNCIACHNGTRTEAGLNLTNYTAAKGAVVVNKSADSLIVKRMLNSGNPMPPSGRLPSLDVDTVRKWIDSGAPEL